MRRVLFVGRTRYASPLGSTHERKFDTLANVFDYRVIGTAAGSGPQPERFTLLHGRAFYARLALATARALRDYPADAIVAQSPFEGLSALAGRRLAGSNAKVIVELHGDWHTASRLYGSPLRARIAPLADRAAAYAVRHADAVRAVSPFTAGLARFEGVEPAAIFHTFTEIDAFVASEPKPLPEQAHLAFVGVLERYKNIDGLADAWRLAAPRLPGVTLELVGRGRRTEVVQALLRDVPTQTVWHERLEPPAVADLLDRSWALVLPSFSEGLPRVALEALARNRAVVGSRAGGIPDAVRDDVNGLLVPPGDAPALADALVRLASDRALAERLSAAGRSSAEELVATPAEYAQHMADLVERALA